MDKKTKKDLERLTELTSREKDLLKGLYGDMFGSSAVRKNSNETFEKNSSGREPSAAELLDQARRKRPDPLEDAKKALKEAQDLMSRTEEIAQNMDESNKKKMEELMKLTNETGEVKPVGMPQGASKGGESAVAAGGPGPEANQEQKPQEPEKDPMEELESLVGLTTIKDDVKELMAFVKIQKMRSDAGLRSVPVSLHLVFTGNPGTGKTTVARIIGRLYKQIGVLSKGQLVEVDRSGLVAGYVGQTAIKTGEAIQKALGGVLFVDEAYALTPQDAGGNDFGREAVEAILKAMEDHRDDLVVIVAGYEELMEQFISSNPGLESRFNRYFLFEDYNGQELYEIFRKMCEKNGYAPDDEAAEAAKKLLQDKYEQRDENFGNARDVRNLFENVITVHSNRLASMEAPEKEDLMHVTAEDIEKASLM